MQSKSMLSQDLEVDWRLGAEIFESLLVDHDWGVNTSNWAYFAGALLLCYVVLCGHLSGVHVVPIT